MIMSFHFALKYFNQVLPIMQQKNAVLFAALILRRKYLPVARGKKSGGEGIHTRVAH